MRFIYGFILGVLVSAVTAILYLAFTGGDYLLQLSPRYHEMVSTITALKDAKGQRDQLASRLEALSDSFDTLTRRFNELQGAGGQPAQQGAESGSNAKPAESEAPGSRAEVAPPSAAATP
jgi:hypothetical protein